MPTACQLVRNILAKRHINVSDAQAEDFLCWLFELYHKDIMDRKITLTHEINAVKVSLPNATHGKPYSSGRIAFPRGEAYDFEFVGLNDSQMRVEFEDDKDFYAFTIEGAPSAPGDLPFAIQCKYPGWQEGLPLIERKFNIIVNPNPRSLWRNIPTCKEVRYYKPDQESEYIHVPGGKDIVAASNRGRSHAQEGKPRDDHFQLFHCPDSDWYIMAVADGAGSAQFSRRGSEIACQTAIEHCKKELLSDNTLEEAIIRYQKDEQDQAARGKVSNLIYTIVGNAAFLAHKAINEEAAREGARPKDYATTLMLAICKKFEFGWFIASFWVGDGAMAIYNQKDGKSEISLLGVPDEGEFSGQTRFLTMPEIFADTASLFRRLRFGIRPDFTALMLMTDGVSDPMFGTDANLNNPDKWDQLWSRLKVGFPDDGIGGVDLIEDQQADKQKTKDQLLGWLDFWIPGEHDDRTIAILY